ncbi:uncharacterized protein LOC135653251 isoform X3 [Musa acuminata AAA Group]|uniref:uncharacterized protein LOC135653251 isoform X3 n=2 Tax=Musa acuminata AAA Group TaxID=214697 RepID=UPI0031DBA81B
MGDPGAASRRKNRLPKGGSESSDLHAAARNGDLTTVESICNANPLAVNARDRHSRTPSTDSESKPEGRQARKQRKMEAIQARLIVPLPPTVTSLEQTVSEKYFLERRCAIRSKCRGNYRSNSWYRRNCK